MNFSDIARKCVLKQPKYEAGKPIEYVAREFGLDPDNILKMASNENPFGPSPKAVEAVSKALGGLNYYPDGACFYLREKLSKKLGISGDKLVFGNGSNEILELVAHVLCDAGDEVVTGRHSFVVYKLAALLMGAKCVEVEMPSLRYDFDRMLDAITPKTKIVFMANPNNPTGTTNTQDEVYSFVRSLPEHVVFCYDEAYREFQDPSEQVDVLPLIEEGRNVLTTRTFSKIYGLAGLRCGYAICSPEFADCLNRVREPFNVNSLAQIGAMAALDDDAFVEYAREENKKGRVQFKNAFEKWGLEHIVEGGNFVMAKVGPKALEIFTELQKRGIIVRPNVGYALPEWLRITIGKTDQNERCIEELGKLL